MGLVQGRTLNARLREIMYDSFLATSYRTLVQYRIIGFPLHCFFFLILPIALLSLSSPDNDTDDKIVLKLRMKNISLDACFFRFFVHFAAFLVQSTT